MKTTLLIVLGLLAIIAVRHLIQPAKTAPATPDPVYTSAPANVSAVQPNSCGHRVVCVGIKSIADLKIVISADPVAAGLYRGFNLGRARITFLPRDMWVYVSYRSRGYVYYTKKRRLIRSGEPIITDGTTAILLACGNTFSFERQPNTLPIEPTDIYPSPTPIPESPTEYASPVEELIPPPSTQQNFPLPPPESSGYYTSYLPVVYPPLACCGVPNMPVAVPEPNTADLFFISVGIFGIFGYRLRGRRQ